MTISSPPNSALLARRGCRLGVREGRHAGGSSELPDDRALVGYAHRYHQMHRLWQLRARVRQENDVPEGYFRTWVERYHVSDYHIENPLVDSPDGGKKGSRK